MQFKELKEIKLNLFRKVDFEPKSAEIAALVFLCAGVFGAAFFAGGRVMGDYNEKVAQIFRSESVLAAEDQKSENIAGSKEDASLEGKKVSEAMAGAAGSVKNMALKAARARKAAQEKARITAQIRSGPALSGPTDKLANGLRVCPFKNDHPQRGGATHIDEDCCPDYNETPNLRCYYTSGQMGILKKR